MTPRRIDLHVHTSASDGQLDPTEVVALALRHRLDVIAITDHDTSQAVVPAMEAARDSSLTILPGIELTTLHPNDEVIDVLGYGFRLDDAAMQEQLAFIAERRRTRADRMVQNLVDMGIPLDIDRVYAIAGTGTIGRPHIAQALLEGGHIATFQQAFDQYIGDNGPAYVANDYLTMQGAIDLLHAAGGIAVLAHPVYVKDFADRVPEWVAMGLDGIEVYYSEHGPDLTMRARVLARQHDLVMTGGSDFHRIENGKVILGTVKVPEDVVDNVMARVERYR